MYGSRLATITTRSPCRWRLSVFLSRCGVHSPPSPSTSRSEARRSTSSRTSRRNGTNSARGASPLSRRRSSLLQPRQDSRAATTVVTAAARARKPKASSRNTRVVSSRRSTKLMSWTRTTKPSACSPSRIGMAVTCTLPPGSETTVAQGAQAIGEESGRRAAREGRRRCRRAARDSRRRARAAGGRPPQAAAAMIRSSRVISPRIFRELRLAARRPSGRRASRAPRSRPAARGAGCPSRTSPGSCG